MPRGRRSLQQGGVPALSQSADMSEPRRTRSASSKPAAADEIVVSENPPPPPTKRPRGRPSRASLLASHASSAASSPAPQMTTASHNGKASAISAPSVSSVSTPLDLSSDGEISTPATSKVATPVILEGSASSKSLQPMTSLEVRLPSRDSRANVENFDDTDRALRNSVYSLNPAKGKKLTEIFDSEDEDDGDLSSDVKRDVKTARRLQEEEFARADEEEELPHNMLRQRKRRTAGAEAFPSLLPTRNATKRGRASTRSSIQLAPPAKKSRIIPDSDDHSQSDIDMDAEIAAAAALESKISDAPGFSEDKVSIADSDDAAEEDEDEDEPLSKRKKGKQPAQPKRTAPKGKAPAKRRLNSRSNPKAPGKAAGRGRGRGRGRPRAIVIEDSEDELEIIPDDEVADLISGMTWNSSVSTNVDSLAGVDSSTDVDSSTSSEAEEAGTDLNRIAFQRRAYRSGNKRRLKKERDRLETHHPEIITMWDDMEKMPVIKAGMAAQPTTISRQLKPFQLEGLAWMKEMEKMEWKGGLLGDEMGLGKTIQAVSLIMSDYPAKQPSLVLVPPVALMQWQSEIKSYTDGTLKTFVFHGTNQKAKTITAKELKAYDVIMMSYNSLESMYRKQEKGFKRKNGIHKEKSVIHSINFHRAILDEAHCIKTRSTMTAKACFALQTNYRWCLSGTPLQNRIGELFSLIRFLNIRPFALYLCKQCPCSTLEWSMNEASRCTHCKHAGMQHVSVFNQELLNPIQKFGNVGPGREAFRKLRLMTDRIMLRRLKKDHTNAMELPVKEVHVDRQFFGEEENDFANSIMTNGQRKFDTYVAQGVLLNNYANIFGLIMQMRQVADHPDLLLKKNAEGGQNILVCCICDEPAEDTIRSRCKHDFCRACVSGYVRSTDTPDCPTCHIALSIDLEQPEIEQDENLVKKSSIVNRIKMDDWVSSSKIELLVHDLHKLRSDNASHKSIIFSQFTTMLQLIEWRLRRAGITTVMLDGSMTPAQRQASIEHFMNNVDVECFLVSLKAGGVALNLTEASRVFVVDPWWNPAAEWQSADRCHRIGQTRPCTITRLCIEDSVESRMVLIQEKKANMIHSTINADDKAMESLSPEDMQFLFRGT